MGNSHLDFFFFYMFITPMQPHSHLEGLATMMGKLPREQFMRDGGVGGCEDIQLKGNWRRWRVRVGRVECRG